MGADPTVSYNEAEPFDGGHKGLRISRRIPHQSASERVFDIDLQIVLADATQNLLKQINECCESEAALRQAQKMETTGHLTSGVAHDFNNLLRSKLSSLRAEQPEAAAHMLEPAAGGRARGK